MSAFIIFKMLHELLLALLGNTGGIIIQADSGAFLVNPKL
jgi:hypothetical protein